MDVLVMWPQSLAARYYWQFTVRPEADGKTLSYTGARHWHEQVMVPEGEAPKQDVKFEDGVALYGKYVGNWGGEATVWRFEGVKDGVSVVSRICCPGTALHLEVRVSQRELHEGESYDMAAVRVRILDEHGNIASYAQYPVKWKLRGALSLVGPDTVTAEGGMCGCYVKTVGKHGKASLTVTAEGCAPVVVEFAVK